MFHYFSISYARNLSTLIPRIHGGNLGAIDTVRAYLRQATEAGDFPGTLAFYSVWEQVGDRPTALALSAWSKGRRFCVARKPKPARGNTPKNSGITVTNWMAS